MNIEYNKNDPELAWLANVPDIITDRQIDEIHRAVSPAYLIYRRKKWGVDCYCTSCRRRFIIRHDSDINTPFDEKLHDFAAGLKERRYESYECPYCGKRGGAKSAGRSRRKMYAQYKITVFNVSEDGETIWGVCGDYYPNLNRMNPEEPKDIKIVPDFEQDYIFCIRRGEVHTAVLGCYGGSYVSFPAPKEPYSGWFFYVHYDDDYFNEDQIEQRSFLKYVYKDIPYERKILAMQYHALYPQLEQMGKHGLGEILPEILNGVSYKRTINLAGKNPSEILKLDPNRAAAVCRYFKEKYSGRQYALDIIKTFKRLLKYDGKASVEFAVMWYQNYQQYYKSVYTLLDQTGLSPVKFDNYITKQYEKAQSKCSLECHCHAAYTLTPNKAEVLHWYKDYIGECSELGYDLTDSIINRPKDLMQAHERSSSALRAKIKEEERKKAKQLQKAYQERYKALCNRYAFAGDVFSIIVPVGAADIIREGVEQRNCVAGYAERHITGKTTILFLRRNSELEKSFGTLEIKTDKNNKAYFAQAYAAHNTQLPDDAKTFLDEWLKYANRSKAEIRNRVQVTA